MDWLVFGDDWGVHPSTTQHLIRNLPASDRVVWVNSLAMRAPKLTANDARRIARRWLSPKHSPAANDDTAARSPTRVISPACLPFHHLRWVRQRNARMLKAQVEDVLAELGMARVTALVTNPIAGLYLNTIEAIDRVVYLRLDDYARLPGVDADLVHACEPSLIADADLVAGTAMTLLPKDHPRTLYVPQGVDVSHFGSVPTQPPTTRVLGFFGLLAEWIDLQLIIDVARANPDWTLELVGPARVSLDALRAEPNIKCLGAVAYEALPRAVAHWDAAWLPFVVDDLTVKVNPVKLREYLAAGLPTLSTPLPESRREHVAIGADVAAVTQWLRHTVAADSEQQRVARRASISKESWAARAQLLRSAVYAMSPLRVAA